MTLIRKTCF